ncbi:MAG: class I SAM-dependent methyltransferase [Deltaproteobacteria bacterium]|nr:class I SAM-dependent methyltransferase [Deltaproteobacteria bacterium]MBW1977180.1 class I SAM-dependent methyltransferase [Deltaproteobacteria bacterium]MBW2300252.1 class I SAM-dependent methyltransferase [Deltaproteobacteria bacterium]RLB22756.1 MAG: class I SAM-dependent methyltransferase [Deltaproteobacteria bacterium]
MAEKNAYLQAAHTGKYEKSLGLLGKYDNVRRFWEDQVTGIFLRPALNELVERKRRRLERLRILDLGCGSGDGYDLLMNVTTKDPGIYEYITAVITPDLLREYVGLDINEELLKQAEAYYGHIPKVRFIQGDLSSGLPGCVKEQEPFDVYFTSYGTLSHFHDHENIKIISDICKHAPDGAILVGDWLGRYSYEWQDLWAYGQDQEYFMDYRISYIYPEGQRESIDIESFLLRLMTRDEIMRIIHQAAKESGREIRTLKFFDRSILIGRHIDTGEYNKNCPRKIRQTVNSLFEGYLRTDLENLFVDYVPRPGFDHLNNFFEMFFMSCNALVQYTISILSKYDPDTPELQGTPEVLPFYPEPLKEAMHNMRRVIEGVGWINWGDVRANIIEPHLGYALRKLEMELQPGTGMGHGLIGVFEIRKQAV